MFRHSFRLPVGESEAPYDVPSDPTFHWGLPGSSGFLRFWEPSFVVSGTFPSGPGSGTASVSWKVEPVSTFTPGISGPKFRVESFKDRHTRTPYPAGDVE